MFKTDDNKVFKGVDSNKSDKMVKNLSKAKNLEINKSENLMHIPNIGAIKKPIFLTFSVKKAFKLLKKAFIQFLILHHFNSKYHIWIKTNISGLKPIYPIMLYVKYLFS